MTRQNVGVKDTGGGRGVVSGRYADKKTFGPMQRAAAWSTIHAGRSVDGCASRSSRRQGASVIASKAMTDER